MLEARNLSAGQAGRRLFTGINLRLGPGEVLGLDGVSGAGKTTLGRVLAGLHPPMTGTVTLDGAPLPRRGPAPVQYLHQNPLAAMNPRWRIGRVLAEGAAPAPDLATALAIDPDWLARFPHELSGGQLQRVAILRALAVNPRYLVADEITAALDPVAQLQIWRVLTGLARTQGLGLIVISHDPALLDRLAGANRLTL